MRIKNTTLVQHVRSIYITNNNKNKVYGHIPNVTVELVFRLFQYNIIILMPEIHIYIYIPLIRIKCISIMCIWFTSVRHKQ